MIYNIVIYTLACFLLGNFSVGLYSIVTYAIGLKAVDFVVDGFDKGKACIIITQKGDEMASVICREMGRGITEGLLFQRNKNDDVLRRKPF